MFRILEIKKKFAEFFMNLPNYYTVAIFLNIFAMSIMIFSVRFNVVLDRERKRMTCLLFSIIIVTSFCEWCGNALNGAPPSLIPLHVLVKTVELSVTPFIGLICARSLSPKVVLGKAAFYLGMVNMVLEIASAFTGKIFYVDVQNCYHHGAFYGIYTVFCAGCIGVFLLESLRVFKRYQQSGGILLSVLTVFLVAGIAVQIFFKVQLLWPTVGLAAVMLYKFYGDIVQQIDSLTELLNRWGYERYLSQYRSKGAILFFDVDRFKQANDCYGHAFGDQSLQIISNCIRHTFARYGWCFRIGGDEFCVILEQRYDEVDLLMQNFAKEMQKHRDREPRLPHVSAGCVVFDTATKNLNDAVAEADADMYVAKRKGREDPASGAYLKT